MHVLENRIIDCKKLLNLKIPVGIKDKLKIKQVMPVNINIIKGSYHVILKVPNFILDLTPFVDRPKQRRKNKRAKAKPTTHAAKFKMDVLKLWDFKCAKCSKEYGTVRLSIHHLLPYWKEKYADYRLDPDYAAPLCIDDCHKNFHKKYSYDEFGPENFFEFIEI